MSCTTCTTPTANVYVKNTFIDGLDGPRAHSSRRVSSAPPALRVVANEEAQCVEAQCDTDGWPSLPVIQTKALKLEKISKRICWADELDEEEGAWADDSTNASGEDFSPAQSTEAEFHMDTDSDDGTSTKAASPCSPCTTQPSLNPWPSRQPSLNPCAAVWMPKEFVAETFEKEAENMAQEMKVALERSRHRVDVMNFRGTWIVSVKLAQTSSWISPDVNRKQAMDIAKKSLLSVAEASACTCILGHCGMPFKPTASGFNAVLGAIQDKCYACPDIYQYGQCRNGDCALLHPTQQMLISIMFK